MLLQLKIARSFSYYFRSLENGVQGVEWEVPDGSTVSDFLSMLSLPERLASVVLVNGVRVNKDRILEENDAVYLAPPMTGG